MIEGNDAPPPTAGSDPGDRAPAPGSLRLIQALVNTLNAETGRDLLGTAPEERNFNMWDGNLDELAIFNSALSARQILELCELANEVN